MRPEGVEPFEFGCVKGPNDRLGVNPVPREYEPWSNDAIREFEGLKDDPNILFVELLNEGCPERPDGCCCGPKRLVDCCCAPKRADDCCCCGPNKPDDCCCAPNRPEDWVFED